MYLQYYKTTLVTQVFRFYIYSRSRLKLFPVFCEEMILQIDITQVSKAFDEVKRGGFCRSMKRRKVE